jgi:hypothetical protein
MALSIYLVGLQGSPFGFIMGSPYKIIVSNPATAPIAPIAINALAIYPHPFQLVFQAQRHIDIHVKTE